MTVPATREGPLLADSRLSGRLFSTLCCCLKEPDENSSDREAVSDRSITVWLGLRKHGPANKTGFTHDSSATGSQSDEQTERSISFAAIYLLHWSRCCTSSVPGSAQPDSPTGNQAWSVVQSACMVGDARTRNCHIQSPCLSLLSLDVSDSGSANIGLNCYFTLFATPSWCSLDSSDGSRRTSSSRVALHLAGTPDQQ